jgi:hypothetical protein
MTIRHTKARRLMIRLPETQPVRAFPNALLDGASNLPIQLNNIKKIPVDIAWTYGLGDSNETSSTEASLEAASEY